MRLIPTALILLSLCISAHAAPNESIVFNRVVDQSLLSCPAAIADIRTMDVLWSRDMTPEEEAQDHALERQLCSITQSNVRLSAQAVIHIEMCQANGIPLLEPAKARLHQMNQRSMAAFNRDCR